MTTSDIAWKPTPQRVERANVTRLMRAHGLGSLAELRRRSVEDVEWFWDAVVRDLDIRFSGPYSRVLDTSDGAQWARWFPDGSINVASVCVDRPARERPHQPAVISEAEDGTVSSLTYAELAAEVDRLAAALRAAGIGKGDAVGVFLPMVVEAVVSAYAVAKIGAIYVPIFSGYAASAVAARLRDAEAKLLVTADAAWRRGARMKLKPIADDAVADVPSLKRVVVVDGLGVDVPFTPDRDVRWKDFVGGHEGPVAPEETSAEDPFLLAYTSGTTGRPKGAVHVHGGFLVKIAEEAAYQTDVGPGDVVHWVTDMGWIMGPWVMLGSHANGATMVMYDGAPDFPAPDRLWRVVERHGVNMLGVSPTLVRALRRQSDGSPTGIDISSLRTIGSTGEPWNPDPYRWLMHATGGGLPIINLSGGTEVGACFLSPHPVEPIKVCSLGGPSLGMDVDVFSADGRPLRNEVGELVCKQPWPGMTRGLWRAPDRYVETYWSVYENVWRHGDWARIDEDGQWFLLGRSDDAINVAGKRLGPAEVESVLVSHPAVVEAAAVGVPDAVKGQSLWCFCVARDAEDDGGHLPDELRGLVAEALGKPFKPGRVVLVDALPKTRSAKIIRRAVRAVALGEDPGDVSNAENPEALQAVRRALA